MFDDAKTRWVAAGARAVHSLVWCSLLLALSVSVVSPAWSAGPKSTLGKIDMDAWVAQFEGAWSGGRAANRTPFGPMPFVFLFEPQDDGGLDAFSALSKETWIQLRFHRDNDNEWLLTEAASLQGLGVQSHTMRAQSIHDGVIDWVTDDPDFMTCRLGVIDDELDLVVTLRGKEHVYFRLARVEDAAEIAELRGELAADRERDGSNDMQYLMALGQGGDDPGEVAAARARVQVEPENAGAHMALGRVLSDAIQSADPMKMAAYAGEMLQSFEAAVQLEPEWPKAHFSLSQYYLNAPPFAGGSVEKARATAATLAKLKSPLAELVLAQADAKDGELNAATERLQRLVRKHPDLKQAASMLARLETTRSENAAADHAQPASGVQYKGRCAVQPRENY